MKFEKWQGIGNDFVLLADPDDRLKLTPELVRGLCDRHFGVGADGVIRVAPGTDGAELFMDYVNSDGSIGEMCGNGIRCLALFAREKGLVPSNEIKVGTRAGIKVVWIGDDDRVRVDMGPPMFGPAEIPMNWEGPDALNVKINLEGQTLEITCLSMGNPHAVVFTEDPDSLFALGPTIERHEMFPSGANVEFVTVESPHRVRARVWERGAGETLACGTGACAAAVAAHLVKTTEEKVVVALPGGDLDVEWSGSLEKEAPVYMIGPARKSFAGEVDL
jgi:diaminopimelate epimerase